MTNAGIDDDQVSAIPTDIHPSLVSDLILSSSEMLHQRPLRSSVERQSRVARIFDGIQCPRRPCRSPVDHHPSENSTKAAARSGNVCMLSVTASPCNHLPCTTVRSIGRTTTFLEMGAVQWTHGSDSRCATAISLTIATAMRHIMHGKRQDELRLIARSKRSLFFRNSGIAKSTFLNPAAYHLTHQTFRRCGCRAAAACI